MEADPDWFDASGADEEEENPLEADPNWFDASGAEEEDPVAHDREVLSFILARFQLEFETMSAISIAVLKEIVEATKRADPILLRFTPILFPFVFLSWTTHCLALPLWL